MDKHNETKRGSTHESSSNTGSSSSKSKKRLTEPPKFYNKNYLKRYNHGEVKGNLVSPVQSNSASTFPNQQTGKKNSSNDQTSTSAKSQHKEAQSSPALITISTTILKLAENNEATISERDSASTIVTEITKNPENSINPYNRSQYNRESLRLKQPSEQDYRYSLSNAMSAVRTSYFKSNTDTNPEDNNNELRLTQSYADDESSVSMDLSRHDTFKKIKSKVEEVTKRHKVFLIRGELPRLKEALEERGWIQKYEPSRTRSLPYGNAPSLEAKSLGDVRLSDGSLNERALTYALLKHSQPDFIWDCRNDFHEWDRSISGNVLLNRLQKPALYTSKLGMAHVLQEAHWLHENNVSDVLFPRNYNPSRELSAMVRDFRRCATLAVLKRFVRRMQNASADSGDSPNDDDDKNDVSPFLLDHVEFSIRRCEEYIAELEHEDIDVDADNEISEDEWQSFAEDCEKLLYKADGMANLPKSDPDRLEACYLAAQGILEKLKTIDPQFDLNGERNIWIVKPSNLCCGSGIFMTHDLKTILRKVENKPRDYYVVQKYIERPFLVYETKFDIRQWFLVTSTFPLTIWSFKEALLRLSSKPYSFTSYHEAIHICNTAVQERYDCERRRRRSRCIAANVNIDDSETSIRDQGWDCEKLNEYLKSVGLEGEPYYEKIYPKMVEAIVLTMLAAQDFMDRRRCSFELYGADFMVMEDLSVWLIEINTNPRMHPPSSRITQRLYGSVLDSLVKVVLDLPLNQNADTGGFELVYKQSVPEAQPYLGPCLFAFGKSMTLHEVPATKRRINGNGTSTSTVNDRNINVCTTWGKQYRCWTAPAMGDRSNKGTKVVDFIAYLNTTPLSCNQRQQNEER